MDIVEKFENTGTALAEAGGDQKTETIINMADADGRLFYTP